MTRRVWLLVLAAVFSGALTSPASAQFAVIDVAAIVRLIQQYVTLQQQLATARNQLDQARQQYDSLRGDRGMQHILEGVWRNYLPGHWEALDDALYGRYEDFPAFQRRVKPLLESNAVLTPEQLARFSAKDQLHIDDMRHSVASLQALSRQALGETSERFNGLQELITAIGRASDPKDVMDLQARIQAEQVMLANDEIKVRTIFQSVQAEEDAQHMRRDEQAIADIGSYRNLPPLDLPLPERAP